jgi:hypothetical protein
MPEDGLTELERQLRAWNSDAAEPGSAIHREGVRRQMAVNQAKLRAAAVPTPDRKDYARYSLIDFLRYGGLLAVEYEAACKAADAAVRSVRREYRRDGRLEGWLKRYKEPAIRAMLQAEITRLDGLLNPAKNPYQRKHEARLNRERVERHYYRKKARALGILLKDDVINLEALAKVTKPKLRGKIEVALV